MDQSQPYQECQSEGHGYGPAVYSEPSGLPRAWVVDFLCQLDPPSSDLFFAAKMAERRRQVTRRDSFIPQEILAYYLIPQECFISVKSQGVWF